jgi:hypothetical protein
VPRGRPPPESSDAEPSPDATPSDFVEESLMLVEPPPELKSPSIDVHADVARLAKSVAAPSEARRKPPLDMD